jgi:hypothetical protein
MAHRTLVTVNLGPGGESGFVSLKRRVAGHLAADARIEWNRNDLTLERKRLIGNSYGRMPKVKPCEHGQWRQNKAEDNSEQNASHRSRRLPWLSSQKRLHEPVKDQHSALCRFRVGRV